MLLFVRNKVKSVKNGGETRGYENDVPCVVRIYEGVIAKKEGRGGKEVGFKNLRGEKEE